MRTAIISALALAGVAASGTAAMADMTFANRAGNAVWITTYDGFGRSFWTRCLGNGQDVTFKSAGAFKVGNEGGLVYVRGELKQNASCGGSTLSDTGRGGVQFIGKNFVRTFSTVGGTLRVR